MRHTVHFSPGVLDAIRRDRYHHPHPRVQLKMEVLWLKSQGLSQQEIARLAGVGRRTVQRYLDEYLEGGLPRLREVRWQGKPCELDVYAGTLEDHFLADPPRTARAAQAAIERLTGIRRGLTQVRAFLKNSACVPAGSGPSRPRRTPRSRRPS